MWTLEWLVRVKEVLCGELFALFRNWLTLQGQGPRCQSIRTQKMKDVVNTESKDFGGIRDGMSLWNSQGQFGHDCCPVTRPGKASLPDGPSAK